MTDNSQNPINKHTNTILDRLHKEYVYSCKVKFSIYLIMRVISSTRATYSFLNTSLGIVSLLIVYVYWASRLPCVWSSPCSKLSVHCGVSPVPVEHSEDVTNLILIIVIKGLHLSNYSQHVGQSCTELGRQHSTPPSLLWSYHCLVWVCFQNNSLFLYLISNSLSGWL